MGGSGRGRRVGGEGEGARVPGRGGAGCLVLRRPWPILPAGGEGRGRYAASAPRWAVPDEGRGRQRAGAPSHPRFSGLQLLVTSLRTLPLGREDRKSAVGVKRLSEPRVSRVVRVIEIKKPLH